MLLLRERYGKYNARRTTCANGHSHPSRGEANRCDELHLLYQAHEIHDLQIQVPFHLNVNGHYICKYVADWTYRERGEKIVEDFKGARTDVYNLKRKLMLAIHNIAIRETSR